MTSNLEVSSPKGETVGASASVGASVASLGALIGRRASWNVDELCSVSVVVSDVRSAYGRVDVFVDPVEGDGGIWVRLTSITLH